jgi:hypothetical protein
MKSHLLAVRKGEDVMSTKTGNMRRAILSGVVGAVIAMWGVGLARADVHSDKPGAILIYPKIVVDTEGVFGPSTDTELQITNTSDAVIAARCFLVNATSHCSNAPDIACTAEGEASSPHRCPLGGACLPQWTETDFRMTLTKRQPVSWKASDGLATFPCDKITGRTCKNGLSNTGSDGIGSSIPPVPEDPFFGEVKCVQVDKDTFLPSRGADPRNDFAGDLKGEATIVAVNGIRLADARKYNAIALENKTPITGDPDVLRIGGPDAEYNGCPNVLILNHFFDNAFVDTHGGDVGGEVISDLTVIPCGEDFRNQENNLGGAVLQFLVYNEFEQRFSTSTNFQCWREVQLSDIDSRPGPFGNDTSIFNVAVEGTLTGQTRIRPVEGTVAGNTVLGITEEFWECDTGPQGVCTTGANLHFTGTRAKGDLLILSPEGQQAPQ